MVRAPLSAELIAALDQFTWYHKIRVAANYTTPSKLAYDASWQFIRQQILATSTLAGASVLDVGCRDGLFSFFAEEHGAAKIVALDNDINPGSILLAALAQSRVSFVHRNLYHYMPTELYDVVFCFGVLYHLRYPFSGLAKLLSFTKTGGKLLLETALYTVGGDPLLYCPYKDSPYEGTSVAFFNVAGLSRALESLGGKLAQVTYQPDDVTPKVRRAFCVCDKLDTIPSADTAYWHDCHTFHSTVQ